MSNYNPLKQKSFMVTGDVLPFKEGDILEPGTVIESNSGSYLLKFKARVGRTPRGVGPVGQGHYNFNIVEVREV